MSAPWRKWGGAPLAALLSLAAFAATAAFLDRRPAAASAPALGPGEEAAIVAAVVDYQRILQDFYASGGNPGMLDAFPATRELKHQLFRDIGFVHDAGLVAILDLAGATVVDVGATGKDAAEAVVYEEWNHVLQRAEDRRPVSPLRGLGQGFRYRLRKANGRWIVSGWDLEDVAKPPEPEGRKW